MVVEQWMRRESSNEVCLMIVENNDQARKVIRDTLTYYQRPELVKELETDKERMHFPFKKIKEAPLFAEKGESSVLQIADFCSYVIKKKLMGDPNYDCFYDMLQDQFVLFDDL